ncbi:hypothetical protein ACHWQZ_G002756 [Mnemiopsis leidyi]
MPEGPELYKAATFLNHIATQHIFKKVRLLQKPSNKHPRIPWSKPQFSLSGEARGKEIRITFSEIPLKNEVDSKADTKLVPETLNILLTFGMAGRFSFTKTEDVKKHSLLMFDTTDDHTFSFVDTRHFGRWILTDEWSPPKKRGPSIITEYDLFRQHVLSSLHKPVFDKPICEVMLEQRYFSCIGNYLRAEILYRLDINPYLSARKVLEHLPEKSCEEKPDILKMCHDVCWEVVKLKGSGKPYDPDGIYGDHGVFEAWLQCYMVEGMGNSVDNKGRTMWHSPKFGKGRRQRHSLSPTVKAEKGASKAKQKKRSKKSKLEPVDVKSELIDSTGEERKPKRTKRKKVKSEPVEDVTEGARVKTETNLTEMRDVKIKLEPDEDFDGRVIMRRSTRLKKVVNENNKNSENNENKPGETTSRYFK